MRGEERGGWSLLRATTLAPIVYKDGRCLSNGGLKVAFYITGPITSSFNPHNAALPLWMSVAWNNRRGIGLSKNAYFNSFSSKFASKTCLAVFFFFGLFKKMHLWMSPTERSLHSERDGAGSNSCPHTHTHSQPALFTFSTLPSLLADFHLSISIQTNKTLKKRICLPTLGGEKERKWRRGWKKKKKKKDISSRHFTQKCASASHKIVS